MDSVSAMRALMISMGLRKSEKLEFDVCADLFNEKIDNVETSNSRSIANGTAGTALILILMKQLKASVSTSQNLNLSGRK